MKYSKIIQNHLKESAAVKTAIAEKCINEIEKAALLCVDVLRNGGTLLLCGNGGSAGDAQHIAAELVVRLSAEVNRRALPAIALTLNTSILTACANDYGYDYVFARQVEAYGHDGDLLIGISTSGSSVNVIRALETAKNLKLHTVAFSGGTGGVIKDIADINIIIPHTDTARIQEGHITVGHILCDIIEKELFPNE